jgi:hypothetical protein
MSLASLTQAALAAPTSDGASARQRLFAELGWRAEPRGRERAASLSLLAGGVPRILVTTAELPSEAASLAYSNESPLVLAWNDEGLRLGRADVWSRTPGDTALVVAPARDEDAARQLLFAVTRERFPGLLAAKQAGEAHRLLADELARAFAHLRASVSETDDDSIDERDVFQLFHQLLFIRFHEDRFGAIDGVTRLSAVLTSPAPTDDLHALLLGYRSHFNSELFGTDIQVGHMPTAAILGVAKAMVEPWDRLRLNFSVAHSDVAGRLYQSFLANTPAVEREGRLFPVASVIDRQRERGAFYTPQPLAQMVAERCLGEVLARKKPATPAGIRVLDPACGSGSFLLAAFRVLARYFETVLDRALSESERLQLLTESLFGGDDDETAVALTRLQVLEEAAVDKSRLPTLGANIGTFDLLNGAVLTRPRGWQPVIASGGFDAILSNPPFHGPRGAQRAGVDTQRLQQIFQSAQGTGWNFASVFLEASLPLLSDRGQLSMLLPQAVLDGPSGSALRGSVGPERVGEIFDFGRNELFAPTLSYVAAVSVEGSPTEGPVNLIRVTALQEDPGKLLADMPARHVEAATMARRTAWFSVAVDRAAFATLDSWAPFVARWKRLSSEYIGANINRFDDPGGPEIVIGTQTGDDRRFVLGAERWAIDGDEVVVDGRWRVPTAFAPLWVRGADLRPFVADKLTRRVVVPQVGEDPAVDLLIEHLGGVPRSFRSGSLKKLRSPKVVLRGLFDEPAAVADAVGEWMIPQGGAGVVAVVPTRKSDVELLEALLNSALYQWLLEGLGHPKAGGYVQLMRHHWKFVPWPRLDRLQRAHITAPARKVRAALKDRNGDRVDRYWRARLDLDEAVFDALSVDAHLRAVVLAELWRSS